MFEPPQQPYMIYLAIFEFFWNQACLFLLGELVSMADVPEILSHRPTFI